MSYRQNARYIDAAAVLEHHVKRRAFLNLLARGLWRPATDGDFLGSLFLVLALATFALVLACLPAGGIP